MKNLSMNDNYARGNACFIMFSLCFVFSFLQGKDGIHGIPGKPGLKASPRKLRLARIRHALQFQHLLLTALRFRFSC